MAKLSADQQAVEDSDLLETGGVVMLPTGGGKTWLARRAIRRRLEQGFKAIYLSPLRALARELYEAWKVEFSGYRVGVYTGELGLDELEDTPAPAEADVIVATPEKLDLYVRGWLDNLDWLAKVGVVVVDELHTLDSGRRGATLEGMVTRLRCINPYLQVLGLSATLGNPAELGRWLGGGHFESTRRPIPLEWRIRGYSKKETKADVALEEVSGTVEAGGQAIVFVQSRQRTVSLVQRFAEGGVKAMAHHAGMSKPARDEAERQYRCGACPVLVATPTLSMGVNLPARLVVLHDLQRWDNGGWEDLSTNEVWQLAGRAGRPGLDDRGEVVLLAPTWNQVAARGYLQGRFEPIRSQLDHAGPFSEQLMVCFGSRLATKTPQAERVMAATLGGASLTPGEMRLRVEQSVAQMIRAGMLEENDDHYVRATRLGRIATRFQLTAKTVISWKRLEEQVETATLFDLLLAICASPDFTARLRVEHDEVLDLQEGLDREAMRLREMDADVRESILGSSGKDVVGAVKTALALRAWTRLGDIAEAASAIECMEHELEEARKEAVRMIQAMSAMLKARPRVVDVGGRFDADMVEKASALAAMVCAGLDDEQATLALVDGIGPVMSRRLAEAGFVDVEALAIARAEDVASVDGVSQKRAMRWIGQAGELILNGGALRYREVYTRIETPASDVKLARGLDYYRWLRAHGLVVRKDDDGWFVSGGSAPHVVKKVGASKYRCNCQDAIKGTRLCKHVIRVMHDEGEDGVPRFTDGFPQGDGRFDLESEWSRQAVATGKRQWR